MTQRMKTAVVAVLALLLVFALVVPAFAHAQLIGSTPADDSSVATAETVTLTFNENVSPDFVTVLVDGPDGDVTAGDPTVEGPVVTQAIAPTTSGEHTVAYRVVSTDGHPVTGEITFTLTDVPEQTAEPTAEPGAAPTAEPSPEPSPEPSDEPADETPTEEATPEPEDSVTDDDGFTWPLGVLATVGILALALIVGVVVYLALPRRARD